MEDGLESAMNEEDAEWEGDSSIATNSITKLNQAQAIAVNDEFSVVSGSIVAEELVAPSAGFAQSTNLGVLEAKKYLEKGSAIACTST
jgi:hypothetical protein